MRDKLRALIDSSKPEYRPRMSTMAVCMAAASANILGESWPISICFSRSAIKG